jgi:hypothetical protein
VKIVKIGEEDTQGQPNYEWSHESTVIDEARALQTVGFTLKIVAIRDAPPVKVTA